MDGGEIRNILDEMLGTIRGTIYLNEQRINALV